MSNFTPTRDSLKEKAKVINKFIKEKYGSEVSHGHCMELISQLHGFKDWNTASAALKPKVTQDDFPVFIMTAGEMKRALEPVKDSARIIARGSLAIKAFQTTMSELGLTQGMLTTEYSFIRENSNDDRVTFQLKTEDQYLSTTGENVELADWTEDET